MSAPVTATEEMPLPLVTSQGSEFPEQCVFSACFLKRKAERAFISRVLINLTCCFCVNVSVSGEPEEALVLRLGLIRRKLGSVWKCAIVN